MKKLYAILLMSVLFLTGCTLVIEQEDIIILFTSDVHCHIDENIGYDGLASYKNKVEKENEYVTLVDLGDAIQGDIIGSVSKGTYLTDIMNYLEYDVAILGNHEFDFGMDVTKQTIERFNGTYVGCNIDYNGTKENALESLEPYKIITYGNVDVAYIGVTTPYTINAVAPTFFMEDGKYVYDFQASSDGQKLINRVQETIDECLDQGADYVIGLTHLGSTVEDIPYSSRELIKGTSGFDAVLDGHAHVKLSSDILEDKEGNDVVLSSVGTQMDAIGQLTITSSGNLSVTVIDEYSDKDVETTNYLKGILATVENDFNKPFTTINDTLSIYDENGLRLIRSREVGLGNLIADAFRYVGGTDIALINSGGIKTSLNGGDVCYADVYKINPHGNTLVTLEVTGEEILKCLEISVMLARVDYVVDGELTSERGGFFQVSGIKFDADTSVKTPVVLDAYEDFLAFSSSDRRVKNVMVLENGEYVPLDPNKTYTVATTNYIAVNGGSSINFLKDNKYIIENGPVDYEVIVKYLIEVVKGDVSAYTTTDGRINIK